MPLTVVHDAQIILSAAGLRAGVVVIAGTGSLAWGVRTDGTTARAGGWGYLLGDEGSGYALARDAVRAALTDVDRAAAPTALARELTAACGLESAEQLRGHFYARPERRYWAARSSLVCDLAAAGEPDAAALLNNAADALTTLAVTVTSRLGPPGPVVLAGGLIVHQVALQDRVRKQLAESGVVDVRVLDRDPVHGAVALAESLLAAPTPGVRPKTLPSV